MCLLLLPLKCYSPCRTIFQIKQILPSTIKRPKKKKEEGRQREKGRKGKKGGRKEGEKKDKCVMLAWRLPYHTFKHQLKESMIKCIKAAYTIQAHKNVN